MNFTQFFSQRNSESNSNGKWQTELVQTKFSMGTPRLDTIISVFNS